MSLGKQKYVIRTHSLKAQVDEDFQTTQRRTNVTRAGGFVQLKDFCSALLSSLS
jgi:hypothetical protein